jgi:aerobic C4-dicarboxylate transport protein
MQTVSTGASPIAPPKKLPWYRKLGMQVLVALILGIIVGFVFPRFASQLKLLGDVFLALIKAGVAPLVFLTIVHGILLWAMSKRRSRRLARSYISKSFRQSR